MSVISATGNFTSSSIYKSAQQASSQSNTAKQQKAPVETAGNQPLGQVFDSADSNGDGKLSSGELTSALGVIASGGGSGIDIKGLMSRIDMDGNGMISRDEFARALPPPAPSQEDEPPSELEEAEEAALAESDDDDVSSSTETLTVQANSIDASSSSSASEATSSLNDGYERFVQAALDQYRAVSNGFETQDDPGTYFDLAV